MSSLLLLHFVVDCFLMAAASAPEPCCLARSVFVVSVVYMYYILGQYINYEYNRTILYICCSVLIYVFSRTLRRKLSLLKL